MNIRKLCIRIGSWEYWPMWIVYFPAIFYYLYLAIRARSLFFFSASNPTIENGGMLFESKWKIFSLIPKELYPKTIYVEEDDPTESIVHGLQAAEITFPVIAKPDVGGRGFGVKKLHSVSELNAYRGLVQVPFLIQSCIDYPLELSVFYYRKPGEDRGMVTSVTFKELLSVLGDGISTIEDLIRKDNRAFLQYKTLKKNAEIDFAEVLSCNEKRTLVPYGNHVLGAKFLDYGHIIDNALIDTFDSISKRIDGFYFGRYDIRCTSIEDLKKGQNISILELNGSGAEPAHIYDPDFSFWKAQFELKKYFKNMYTASVENHKRGVPYMTLGSFKIIRRLEKEYKQKIGVI